MSKEMVSLPADVVRRLFKLYDVWWASPMARQAMDDACVALEEDIPLIQEALRKSKKQ